MSAYNTLTTTEGDLLLASPDLIPWEEYPRPQLVRNSFLCLNGWWDFREGDGKVEKIRVPFAPESILSGIHRSIQPGTKLYYSRSFTLPEGFRRGRVLLHFGAVDQIALVKLNDITLGEHRGGYGHFSFDVTEYIKDENLLEVTAADPLDGIFPYGKQKLKRGGMWYTPTSGIWQTVWMESTPEVYVRALHTEQTENNCVKITADGVNEGILTLTSPGGEHSFPMKNGEAVISLENSRLWSPEDPYLYHYTLRAGEDEVRSYFACRSLECAVVNGIPRILLNGKPYFFHGLLDQGYFADGGLTPASPVCYINDIAAMKRLGFNMLRKHIKIEPERFYYDCDRMGMIVFQDMVNNGGYSFFRDTALPTLGLKKLPDRWLHRNKKSRAVFLTAMEETVEMLREHPCICYWTIFNEGWGQFCGDELYRKLKALDSTRIIDTASGWFGERESDVESLHVYFKPVKLTKSSPRPVILSEFGGYSLKLPAHSFNREGNYGYRDFTEKEAFEEALVKLYRDEVLPAIRQGLCGAVYTQVSDVEDETNGLLTFDRRICKVSEEAMCEVAKALFKAIDQPHAII